MYKSFYLVILALFLAPTAGFAATDTGSLQAFLGGLISFMNNVIIPFILGIAFLIFVVNVVRFFVIGGATDEGQKNAKNLALYSVGAFVFILSFWAIVNLLISGIGFNNTPCTNDTTSDYVLSKQAPCSPPRPPSRPPPIGP